jgi:3-hydroxyacyl-CoA dehydrogenase
MKIEDVKKIAVVGAGIMGSQIAENLSRVGNYKVCMLDKDDRLVKKGSQSIEFRRKDTLFPRVS